MVKWAGRHRWVAAALLYCVTSLIYWGIPVLGHMTTRYVGTGTDPIQFIDAMLWWPWAISHGVNPIVDHWLWSPTGTDLLWITSVPAISLVLSPITLIFGPVVAYNLAMMIGPVLNALSMYLLLSQWVNKYWWKVFGGYLFGFSSYEIGETLGHLHLTWTFVIPLIVLWALKIYRTDEASQVPKKYPLAIFLLLVFQFFVSTEVLTSLVLFGGLFLLLILLADQHNARLLRLIKKILICTVLKLMIRFWHPNSGGVKAHVQEQKFLH
ncbi:MAG: hypothetical protein M1499_00975 [Firmicutes bacterium]|nr:hypothetical protein [Bacillota bacterium]